MFHFPFALTLDFKYSFCSIFHFQLRFWINFNDRCFVSHFFRFAISFSVSIHEHPYFLSFPFSTIKSNKRRANFPINVCSIFHVSISTKSLLLCLQASLYQSVCLRFPKKTSPIKSPKAKFLPALSSTQLVSYPFFCLDILT